MVSIPPVPLSEGAYVNLEEYVAPGGCSQRRTHSLFTTSPSLLTRSPRGVVVMLTREPSMVRGFTSNVCGCMPTMGQKLPQKCIIDNITLPVRR